ncbi:DUF3159 domain-containing protein [Conexibacter sp. SYSU D00693]|uniref:DUF3159 domain-containing protein n=1 Tax=Conexibacter sp. SYSU D00693 TaxID=2812560 RepID=UPI00196B0CAA|nr:DUF3159 domain-containing protein [Conexibacter sp. SYSU D00693]
MSDAASQPAEPDTGPRPEGAVALAEALGGRLGILESSLPAGAFAIAYAISGSDLELSALIAVAVGACLTIARLLRRETLQFALAGVVGVAIAAFIANKTGRAEDFYLPGLFINLAYAAAYAISILVGYPLLGVLVGAVTGEGMAWREDPVKVRAYSRASWIWVGLFLARIAVQAPLYLAGAVVVLGAARVAMGLPLFAVGIWLSYLVLRKARVL